MCECDYQQLIRFWCWSGSWCGNRNFIKDVYHRGTGRSLS